MTDDGGPAFPNPTWASGMTLRDWFAGQVAAALVGTAQPDDHPDMIAEMSYLAADALLEARK